MIQRPDPHEDAILLRAEGVTKQFREGDRLRSVLRGVDLCVRQGEIVALLGQSGSGKSTLLNVLSGIDHPDQGAIRIDNIPVSALSERARTLFRRHHIGFIYQFFNLIPTLTVLENVRLPLELIGRRPPADDEARGLLQSVGLSDRTGAYPDRLSGGEQQRVAIARALVHGPALVLADEPTGNLDADAGRRVLDLLQGLVRQRRQTVLLVTHAREVARRADRVLQLRDGRLEAAEVEAAW